jgi:hypothetical protein
VAVRKYKHGDEFICDYFVSTYSYKKHLDRVKIACGGITAGAGTAMAFGAMALGATATGGVSVVIGSVALAAIGSLVAMGGGAMAALSADTSIDGKFKKILEANFMYKLEQKGYAKIEGRDLYLDC